MKETIIKMSAMICLFLAVVLSWNYNSNHYPGAKDRSADGRGDGQIVEKHGTYCTLKSNSLDGVPIYDQAGSTFQIALIPEGKSCQLKAETTSEGEEWARIDYCGLDGWLKKDALHFISEEDHYIREGSLVYMNSITEKGIKSYKKPSLSAKEMTDGILYGDEFTVDKLEKGWGRTEIRGKKVWINMFHMGSYPSDHWKVETLSSAEGINLREGPGENQKSKGRIPENTKLTIKRFDHGWGYVTYEGKDGWVMLHYLTPVS